MESKLTLRPDIRSAREVRRYDFGDFRATFFDEIISFDVVEYAYIMILYSKASDEPVLYFTSEKDASPLTELFQRLGIELESGEEGSGEPGSHFFCVFDKHGHSNYGASNDWGDADKFEQEALKAIGEGLEKVPTV